ncbi:MAG: glycosyl transferase family 2, partial [Ilumatobacteraceae bacterium]|nr:glycosyl transferase family 2 [Ilumatobacteraceae bacterium]
MPGPRISLNVIVYNEEDRLEQTLLDARPHVDEIVVVDQMSTDATPEIAQRLADVYIRDVHHGHAEPSRELAAARSSGDWILVLDADESMSDLLKTEIRDLVQGEADGYWIRKSNLVDGIETGTVLHLRLVRKSRAWFDPVPHGGARVTTENVATFDRIGILHPKSEAEQLYDDARYEQIAAEEHAPSSSKRLWLSHNRTLRAHRATTRRSDLEALLTADARRVLVLGDVLVELPDSDVVRVDDADQIAAAAGDQPFDAAVISLSGADRADTLRSVAAVVRPGGSVVGTVIAARNLRRVEAVVAALVGDGPAGTQEQGAGTTRRALFDELDAAGLDARWMRLVRDGWLVPVALRPDGTGAIVESSEFLLRSVQADVAEELTAAEIVFAAAPRDAAAGSDVPPPLCSIIVAPLAVDDARRFADALLQTMPSSPYE